MAKINEVTNDNDERRQSQSLGFEFLCLYNGNFSLELFFCGRGNVAYFILFCHFVIIFLENILFLKIFQLEISITFSNNSYWNNSSLHKMVFYHNFLCQNN